MTSIHGTSAQAPSMHRLAALYIGDSLPEALDLIDQLHTAVSEGHLPRATTLSQDEVVGLLQDLIFVAQETLNELNTAGHSRVTDRHDKILKLVQKR